MRRPPMLLHMRIRGEESGFVLWLPLFLVWLPVLALLIILSPLLLLVFIVLLLSGWGVRALVVAGAIYQVLCATRGLKFDINSGDKRIYFTVV